MEIRNPVFAAKNIRFEFFDSVRITNFAFHFLRIEPVKIYS